MITWYYESNSEVLCFHGRISPMSRHINVGGNHQKRRVQTLNEEMWERILWFQIWFCFQNKTFKTTPSSIQWGRHLEINPISSDYTKHTDLGFQLANVIPGAERIRGEPGWFFVIRTQGSAHINTKQELTKFEALVLKL